MLCYNYFQKKLFEKNCSKISECLNPYVVRIVLQQQTYCAVAETRSLLFCKQGKKTLFCFFCWEVEGRSNLTS